MPLCEGLTAVGADERSLAAVGDEMTGEVAGVRKGPWTVGALDGLPLTPSVWLVIICGGTKAYTCHHIQSTTFRSACGVSEAVDELAMRHNTVCVYVHTCKYA